MNIDEVIEMLNISIDCLMNIDPCEAKVLKEFIQSQDQLLKKREEQMGKLCESIIFSDCYPNAKDEAKGILKELTK